MTTLAPVTLLRAAEYIRMSTEDQKYSPENQTATNQMYAERHGMEIVHTYFDKGKSGLTFDRRDALRQMIEVVLTEKADFKAILVYDVSRWGRFQDPDESAYYEYICKRAGISVHYPAEPFENDGSPMAAAFKGLKRAMAAEFSRELSVKVFDGQARLIGLGFRLGGTPGYGYRRLLIDLNRTAKCVLASGERKSITTDRVILVPGPPHEVEIVRWIYATFVHVLPNEAQIAAALNEKGLLNHFGRPWTHRLIRQILQNEKYIGNSIWNQSSFKLQKERVRNSPEKWLRVEGAFKPIVDRSLFDAAQAVFGNRTKYSYRGRPRGLSDEEMIDGLRRLWREHGYLSRVLIDSSSSVPSSGSYHIRFGGLTRPYKLIGYRRRWSRGVTPSGRPHGLPDSEMLELLRQLLRERGNLTRKILVSSKRVPWVGAYCARFGSLSNAYRLIGFVPDPKLVRARRPRLIPNEDLLDGLRELWHRQGRLSRRVIEQNGNTPSRSTIEQRFGGLLPAYQLIGYTPDFYRAKWGRPNNLSDEEMLEALRTLWKEKGYLSQKLIVRSRTLPTTYAYYKRFGGLGKAFESVGFKVDRRPRSYRGR